MLVNRSHEAIWHPLQNFKDYVGVCELRTIDSERYKRVVEAERQRLGKVSAKSIELRCRAVINEYRVQSNRLEDEKKPLPLGGVLYPQVSSSRNP